VSFVLLVALAVCAAIRLQDLVGKIQVPSDVVQHFGYIQVNQTYNANLFYWMFESQGNPSTDPVVIWMTGGPGCSSELALLFENGPFTVDANGNTQPNPYSWNKFANIIYIDQPADVGFSYANTDYVHDEAQVGQEMYTFLQGFFSQYPQYSTQPFFITGESFGGHYVPTVAVAVIVGNSQGQGIHINLQGVAIGNGWVDPEVQYGGYGPFAFQNNLIDSDTFSQMNQTLQQCTQLIDQGQLESAEEVCGGIMGAVLDYAGNLNVYNIKLQCNPQPLCYDFTNQTNYLNTPSVQQQLGVASQDITWETCNDQVNGDFGVDVITSYRYEIPVILTAGIPVVIYNGDLDLICNWVGGKLWVDSMDWRGQSTFASTPLKPWKVNGVAAGEAKSFQGFTFVRVYQAGHMVPHDQPANALDLLFRVVKKKP